MKVVLVTKIKNLGDIGDIVDVKAGFARNFYFHIIKLFLQQMPTLKILRRKRKNTSKSSR